MKLSVLNYADFRAIERTFISSVLSLLLHILAISSIGFLSFTHKTIPIVPVLDVVLIPPKKVFNPQPQRHASSSNAQSEIAAQGLKTSDQTTVTTSLPLPTNAQSLLERSVNKLRTESAYFSNGRTRRVNANANQYTAETSYLEAWRQKVEQVGNLNYPQAARQQRLYGNLRLLVALFADGTIKNVEILQSSGYPLLDAAAVRIVQLAAPFAPFPIEVRKTTDVLEIIRTWKFEQGGFL